MIHRPAAPTTTILVCAFVLCALLAGSAAAGRRLAVSPASFLAHAAQGSAGAETPQIKVDVRLVSVVASVLSPTGQPVTNLTRESFELYEEGVKQKVEAFEAQTQQPLDLALMIDTSASTFAELQFARHAAGRFLKQVVRPVDRVGMYQFSDGVEELARFTNSVPALEASLAGLSTGGGTALYDALVLGAEALGRRPPSRRRVIVLVTDAGESSSLSKFEDARRAPLAAEAMLYTILIRPVKNESGRNTGGEHALITITDVTGGATYTVDSEAEMSPTFDRIDRELRTQYLLGFYPTPRPPARAFRKLEVRVKAAGAPDAGKPAGQFVVRHRQGYFTSP